MAKLIHKTNRTSQRNCIAILFLASVVLIHPLFAQAPKSTLEVESLKSQLSALEIKILSKEFQTDTDITRIRRLEHLVFPKEKPDSGLPLNQRISRVLSMVTGQEDIARKESPLERSFLERRKEFYKADPMSLLQQSTRKPLGVWEHKTPNLSDTSLDANSDVVLILLDCSNSMKAYSRIGFSPRVPNSVIRQSKLDVAKSLIVSVAQRLPSKTIVGLRTLGAPTLGNPILDCKQTKLAVPLDENNRRRIVDQLRDLEPFGITPLEYALRQAAESDLSKLSGNRKIILICDGADTCGGNPCEFVKQLPRLKLRIQVDVVGISVTDVYARGQLQCIADSSGGNFYDLGSTKDLAVFLQNLSSTRQHP